MADHSAAVVLFFAAQRISRDGWIQGVDMCGVRCCALTALTVEAGSVWSPAHDALVEHLGDAYESVVAWNDAPGRTADEVIATLRECAQRQI